MSTLSEPIRVVEYSKVSEREQVAMAPNAARRAGLGNLFHMTIVW
jgi:hypothetical protein